MDFKHFVTWICLVLLFLLCQINCSDARPEPTEVDDFAAPIDTIDRFDDEYYETFAQPLNDYQLRRLRRGYYYVDDGYISEVPVRAVAPSNNRRQDVNTGSSSSSNGVRYTPLVKFRQTRTKRKKLFVPNLFG